MILNLSPMRRDYRVSVAVHGDVLSVDGIDYDFSAVVEGVPVPQEEIGCEWLVGDVVRKNGEIELTLILSHGARAPQETLFPAPIHATTDGNIALPPYDMSA